ncbi:MAG TPA: hemerythrin domain-containing protein [Burkholderiaceae bacterium]|jgi:hemerythrin-like domain-containing protein|nr:hemerythrin domain-containing protein [Burkholderiaceae bacterium]
MAADTPAARAADADFDPMQLFSGCHARIHERMGMMQALAEMLDVGAPTPPAAARLADTIVRFYESTVLAHHREEEQELWPMLERVGNDSDIETFKAIGKRLKDEHQQLEALWDSLTPELRRLAKGKAARIDPGKLSQLAQAYDQHAAFEDAVVIPMARFLLSPSDQSRLNISIALRRMPVGLRSYI